MPNKRVDQLPRASTLTGAELIVTADATTGEMFGALISVLLSAIANKSEIILFTAVAQLTLAWDISMQAKYGASGKFYVEIVGDDGIARNSSTTEIIPDSLSNTTSYHFDFGGVQTGRITVF